MFALEKGKKGGKLGECEAALKRRTDRPIIQGEANQNMAINYSNEIRNANKKFFDSAR